MSIDAPPPSTIPAAGVRSGHHARMTMASSPDVYGRLESSSALPSRSPSYPASRSRAHTDLLPAVYTCYASNRITYTLTLRSPRPLFPRFRRQPRGRRLAVAPLATLPSQSLRISARCCCKYLLRKHSTWSLASTARHRNTRPTTTTPPIAMTGHTKARSTHIESESEW
ncbi:hypothetical protein R3P38DRAFT_3296166 [Favolaschia claudopus]|uniref:Uncharacterized protein n=1 Tax=Favolaschia claudopus TaxID=2862362 RepID=A0AAV9ZAT9_9AGAR